MLPTMLPPLLLPLSCAVTAAPQQQWYVSLAGRDDWSGTLPEPNAACT